MLAAIANTGRFIASHPLTRDRKLAAFARFARWQVESRLRTEVIVPWVGGTRLAVRRGMHGATGNIYAGLQEFTEMAFVLHLLRAGDFFADVGANIGSYTVLAAGVRGARVLAVEPGSAARAALTENIALNGLSGLVRVEPAALGDTIGTLTFSMGDNATNHVVGEGGGPHELVPQTTADALFADECPVALKLDVEGYEAAVFAGASAILANSALKALIVELGGSGRRYGFDDKRTHQDLLDRGFAPYDYDPLSRMLSRRGGIAAQNTIYLRGGDWVRQRLETAPTVRLLNREI